MGIERMGLFISILKLIHAKPLCTVMQGEWFKRKDNLFVALRHDFGAQCRPGLQVK